MALFMLATVFFLDLISTSSAYNFIVGGANGSWVQNPKVSYNTWAQRMRFQVNDKVVFKYNKTEDSVLLVNREDYESCNTSNPIQKLGGDEFQFTRSGLFYFVSGVSERCKQGEKLIVVVMAQRNKKPAAPSPSPLSSRPLSLSPSPSPSSSRAKTPSPSPAPSTHGRDIAPVAGPAASPERAPPATSSSSSSSITSGLVGSRVALGVVALVLGHAVLG